MANNMFYKLVGESIQLENAPKLQIDKKLETMNSALEEELYIQIILKKFNIDHKVLSEVYTPKSLLTTLCLHFKIVKSASNVLNKFDGVSKENKSKILGTFLFYYPEIGFLLKSRYPKKSAPGWVKYDKFICYVMEMIAIDFSLVYCECIMSWIRVRRDFGLSDFYDIGDEGNATFCCKKIFENLPINNEFSAKRKKNKALTEFNINFGIFSKS
jgi:hypothetical protein